jgi:hypothetical protein
VKQTEVTKAISTVALATEDQLKKALVEISLPAGHRAILIADGMLTSEDAAQFLGITQRQVNRYACEGRLGTRFGEKVFIFDREELARFSETERIVGKHRT